MGATTTTLGHILKELWPNGIHEEMLGESALLAMIRKETDFEGRTKILDVVYGGNRSRSADAAKGFAGGSQTSGVAFNLTRAKNYASFKVDREVILASKSNRGALVRAIELELGSAKNTFKEDVAADLYSTGTGRRGKVGALAGSTITLDNTDEIRHFDVGDVIQLSATDGTGAVKAGTLTVSGVNRDTGVLTFTTTVAAGIATAAVADFIFKDGDYGQKAKGIDAWLPATAPGATPFFGVNRSVDPTRLGGIRFDGTAFSHVEALIRGLKHGYKHGAKPDHVFVSPDDFGAIEIDLGPQKRYEDVEVAGFGFTSLAVNGPNGKTRIFQDPWCPSGAARALRMEHWALHSLTEFCHVVMDDGLKMQRVDEADSFAGRLAGYYQFGCEAPGQNIRIALPSV